MNDLNVGEILMRFSERMSSLETNVRLLREHDLPEIKQALVTLNSLKKRVCTNTTLSKLALAVALGGGSVSGITKAIGLW